MAESDLHRQVKMAVTYWLRYQRRCTAIAPEVALGDVIADILGAAFSGPWVAQPYRRTFLVEVKVSRPDFNKLLRRKEPQIRLYDGRVVPVVCDYNFLAVPAGLAVAADEVPAGWGLLHATGSRWVPIEVVKRAKRMAGAIPFEHVLMEIAAGATREWYAYATWRKGAGTNGRDENRVG